MSGPKRTSYSISRALYQQRKREQNERRRQQIEEITSELEQCTSQLQGLLDQYENKADYICVRVETWMEEAKQALSNDLRDSWRSLRGIKNYLDKEKIYLEQREARDKQIKEKAQQRLAKVQEGELEKEKLVNKAITDLEETKEKIIELEKVLGDNAFSITEQPKAWIMDSEKILHQDPGSAINSIKGANNFIESKQTQIESLRKESLRREKIERIVHSLETIEGDYPNIINDGIRQRIKLFSDSIKANPDNQNTLSQIDKFKDQVRRLQEEHNDIEEDRNLVANTFSEVLNSSIEIDKDGAPNINGTIEGVPISVRLDNNNNNIHMDTPNDGTCRAGLDALQQKLKEKNIDLGEIKIVNSGEILNRQQQQTRRKLDA